MKPGIQGRREMGNYWRWMLRRGPFSVSEEIRRDHEPQLGNGLRVLSSSIAWDTVQGAGHRPVRLCPPGVCIYEREGEISGVEDPEGQ